MTCGEGPPATDTQIGILRVSRFRIVPVCARRTGLNSSCVLGLPDREQLREIRIDCLCPEGQISRAKLRVDFGDRATHASTNVMRLAERAWLANSCSPNSSTNRVHCRSLVTRRVAARARRTAAPQRQAPLRRCAWNIGSAPPLLLAATGSSGGNPRVGTRSTPAAVNCNQPRVADQWDRAASGAFATRAVDECDLNFHRQRRSCPGQSGLPTADNPCALSGISA